MRLPYLKDTGRRTKKTIFQFRGVNYSEAVQDGQLEDCRNISSQLFPCLSPRGGRERGTKYENATAVWYKDGLLVVDGNKLIYNGAVVGTVTPGKKQFANINTKVVIMPDKLVFDTKTGELRGMSAEYTTRADSVQFESGDNESRLLTHIGTYVEGIVGSGNVGGNDALGRKDPAFCEAAPPFTTVYENGSVDSTTGAPVFGNARTGITAEEVEPGNAFIAAGLNADGTKRFGRITRKTKFLPEGVTAGAGPYHSWNRYAKALGNLQVSRCTFSGPEYEHGCFTGFSHPVIEGFSARIAVFDLRLWTKTSNRTVELAFGSKLIDGQDGYMAFENEKRVTFNNDDLSVTIGPLSFTKDSDGRRHAGFTVGLVEDGHITTCLELNARDPNNNLALTHITAAISADFEIGGGAAHNCVSIVFEQMHCYSDACVRHTDGPLYKKGTAQGIVFDALQTAYPQDGILGDSWYTYHKVYQDPAYYGFDYDLIAANDGGGEYGFEKVNFRKGDTVEISGCITAPKNNISATIRDIGQVTIDGLTMQYLQFDGGLFTAGNEAGAVTISRKTPNLSIVCENQNRLFGAEGNTIYVSALGDPTNLYTYDGLDTDSYAVAVSTEGHFTGCIGFGKSVLFFKEDCMHRLMGDYPSEYQLYDYKAPGVLQGSEESLWNVNEVVYYHGREGVYRYNGGAPELISENFGLRRFDTAAAGAAGDRYYISMRDKETGEWGLWVYDAQRDIWLQEDKTQAVCFVRDGGKLYYIDGKAGDLVLTNPDSSDEEVEWSATTCRIDEVYLNRKCYSRLFLRVDLEEDAEIKVEISCDDGVYREVSVVRKAGSKTAVVPVVPNRCDNFRIRMTGRGKVKLRSLEREYNVESEY